MLVYLFLSDFWQLFAHYFVLYTLVVLWGPRPGPGAEEPHRYICRHTTGLFMALSTGNLNELWLKCQTYLNNTNAFLYVCEGLWFSSEPTLWLALWGQRPVQRDSAEEVGCGFQVGFIRFAFTETVSACLGRGIFENTYFI